MLLLLDIGNTHTHAGLTGPRGIIRTRDFPTPLVLAGGLLPELRRWLGRRRPSGAGLCSVVPDATGLVQAAVGALIGRAALQLTPQTIIGVGLDYPHPEKLGQDRLANVVAARAQFGAPVVAVDFGTAVTFDVVNAQGNFIGGIIAPGLGVMTDYLHEKTAQLPQIRIREPRGVIGRNTSQAMQIGAVLGYRGMVRELIGSLRKEMGVRNLPVVATGGYARLLARRLPEIDHLRPHLTLEGLRLVCLAGSEGSGTPVRCRQH